MFSFYNLYSIYILVLSIWYKDLHTNGPAEPAPLYLAQIKIKIEVFYMNTSLKKRYSMVTEGDQYGKPYYTL